MKRPVSLVASLALALGTMSGCGGAAGKSQLAEVCSAKMSSTQKCSCFSDALEKGLSAEEFTKVAQAIDDNKRFNGLLPSTLSSDPSLSAKINDASQACFN
jgi:hypothetical protein